MNSNLVVIRTISGEYFIGEVLVDGVDNIVLTNSMNIQIMPTPRGLGMSFLPINFIDPKNNEANINKNYIIQITKDIPDELKNEYISKVSGIKIASQADMNNILKT